jgi:hypothetical protein
MRIPGRKPFLGKVSKGNETKHICHHRKGERKNKEEKANISAVFIG